jgi:hypothetical protein
MASSVAAVSLGAWPVRLGDSPVMVRVGWLGGGDGGVGLFGCGGCGMCMRRMGAALEGRNEAFNDRF